MSPKGVMKSCFYDRFLKLHLRKAKLGALKALAVNGMPLTEENWKSIPKFSIDDNAPGHSDKAGCDDLKKFWLDIKEKDGWENQRIPKNSSDRTQPGDLGVNKELQSLYGVWSSKFVDEEGLTSAGNLKLPGQELLLKWYIRIWKELSNTVIKSSWDCSAIPKFAGSPKWPNPSIGIAD